MDASVRIYVDVSNVLYGARNMATRVGEDPLGIRLHARRLRDVLAGGRPILGATAVMSASTPSTVRARFAQWFAVIDVERGVLSGRDQAADERLQNRMYHDIHRRGEPSIIVLATGDGAGWASGSGFTQPLIAARHVGMGVEVAAFRSSLHPQLRRLAEMPGNAMIELDRHYESFTFLQGGLRFPEPISLRHRPWAQPHRWAEGELDWLTATSGTRHDSDDAA